MNVSYFFSPALRLESLLRKIDQYAVDFVVLDLEDSVHCDVKFEARTLVRDTDLSPIAERGIGIGVRVNAISTFDGLADLQMLRSLLSRDETPIRTVFLPMVQHSAELRIYRELFEQMPVAPRLFTFIETIPAVEDVDRIAASSDALCFGQADLVSKMYQPNAAFIDYARARLCIAASVHGIEAIDTNSFEISDQERIAQECRLARSYGFTGKAIIHPNQIAAVREILRVDENEFAAYRATIADYYGGQQGFSIRDGRVVAPPFVAKARHMLRFYGREADQ